MSELLTPRELEILNLMAQGLRNNEIAARLGITYQTVKNHQHAAYQALEVDGHIEAFIALGWLNPPRTKR